MNILGLSNHLSGCGWHRVVLPLGFMDNIKGYVTNIPTKELMQEHWDIITYNRRSVIDDHHAAVRNEFNCKIVVDIDDYWVLPPSHILHKDFQHIGPVIERNLSDADLVTCTNDLLAEKCRPLNSNVIVIPNALPFGFNQYNDARREDERVRIFWAGSITHQHDIEMLRNPLKRLQGISSKIKMVIAGYDDHNIESKSVWDKMVSAFTAGGSLPYMKIHGTVPECYMQAYENADVMLIPLENHEWHRMKSNLKILEAASKRIPCIVSKVQPYMNDTDAPVLWVERQSDWYNHINYLVNNKTAKEDLGNNLYEWAKEKYSIFEVNKIRRSAFADLIKS